MRVRWMFGYPLMVYAFGQLVLKVRVTGQNKLVCRATDSRVQPRLQLDPLLVGLGARREVHFLGKEESLKASRSFDSLITRVLTRGRCGAAAWTRPQSSDAAWLLGMHQTVVLFP